MAEFPPARWVSVVDSPSTHDINPSFIFIVERRITLPCDPVIRIWHFPGIKHCFSVPHIISAPIQIQSVTKAERKHFEGVLFENSSNYSRLSGFYPFSLILQSLINRIGHW